MKLPMSVGRLFSNPITLWGLFAIVFLMTTVGLGLLSRHALELSRRQWISEREANTEQNIRIALWRLDSKLGPYLATLHDSRGTLGLGDQPDDFVVRRFRVEPSVDETDQHSYVVLPMSGRIDSMSPDVEPFGLPVETLVSTVNDHTGFCWFYCGHS